MIGIKIIDYQPDLWFALACTRPKNLDSGIDPAGETAWI